MIWISQFWIIIIDFFLLLFFLMFFTQQIFFENLQHALCKVVRLPGHLNRHIPSLRYLTFAFSFVNTLTIIRQLYTLLFWLFVTIICPFCIQGFKFDHVLTIYSTSWSNFLQKALMVRFWGASGSRWWRWVAGSPDPGRQPLCVRRERLQPWMLPVCLFSHSTLIFAPFLVWILGHRPPPRDHQLPALSPSCFPQIHTLQLLLWTLDLPVPCHKQGQPPQAPAPFDLSCSSTSHLWQQDPKPAGHTAQMEKSNKLWALVGEKDS